MNDNYVCEHLGFDDRCEDIPHAYDDEFDTLSDNDMWPRSAYIILKSCAVKPIKKFSPQDIIATTEHLALVKKQA